MGRWQTKRRSWWSAVTSGIALALSMVALQHCGGGDDGDSGAPPVQGSGPSQVAVRDFGSVQLRLNGAASVDVQVESASSFMLIADGGGTLADVDIDSLVDPNGGVFVTPDPNDEDPIGRNELQAAGDSLASWLFPHTPQYGIPPGTYRFRVRSFNAPTGAVRVLALINHRVDPAGGALETNLIFCGIPDLNSANALQHPQFQVLFDEFRRIYALAQIQVSIAGLFDCDPSEAARLTFLNLENEEFGDLLAGSRSIENQALNFFFVQGIENGPIAGVAGKIAGPALIQGTRYSGVVVTTLNGPIGELSRRDLLLQGNTMAHEGGHYMGLYHTTESRGAGATVPGLAPKDFVDPIDDTPACPAANDTNGNGTVSAAECASLDGTNLMFWGPAPDGQTQDRLTVGQQFVLHRSPYVH